MGIDQPSAASVGTQGHLQSADQLTVEMPTWASKIQNNNNNSGSQSQDQGHLNRKNTCVNINNHSAQTNSSANIDPMDTYSAISSSVLPIDKQSDQTRYLHPKKYISDLYRAQDKSGDNKYEGIYHRMNINDLKKCLSSQREAGVTSVTSTSFPLITVQLYDQLANEHLINILVDFCAEINVISKATVNLFGLVEQTVTPISIEGISDISSERRDMVTSLYLALSTSQQGRTEVYHIERLYVVPKLFQFKNDLYTIKSDPRYKRFSPSLL